jgi:hypothetical protein
VSPHCSPAHRCRRRGAPAARHTALKNDPQQLDVEWTMHDRFVSAERSVSPDHDAGSPDPIADIPGRPSPPAVTGIRPPLRERSRNGIANAGPRPGPTAPAAVRRWKLWLLTVCGIYPTIVLLGLATNPFLEDLYLPVRLAVLVPAAAAAMVWQINPRLQRRFGAWLTR